MQRIAVVGTTCSGKTTLARELARRLRIPFIEEDAILWGPNWTEAPRDVRLERITDTLKGEAWVVDGNMFSLGHPNLRRADTAIWLDLPLSVIWPRLALRTARRILTQEELWAGNRETLRKTLFDPDSILWYALRTYRNRRKAYAALFPPTAVCSSDARPPAVLPRGREVARGGAGIIESVDMSALAIANRMLRHNEWATHVLLERCRLLSSEQFHQRFEIGPGSLHDTLRHIVGTMFRWSDRIADRPLRPSIERDPAHPRRTPEELLALLNQASRDLEEVVSRIGRENRYEAMMQAEFRPERFTRGTAIVHVLTHGVHNRAQALNMLRHLSAGDVPELDTIEWEIKKS